MCDHIQTISVEIPRRSAELFVSDSDGAAAAGLQAVHEIVEVALSQILPGKEQDQPQSRSTDPL